MVPPLGLLGVLVAGLYIERIVRWSLLLLATGEHGDDAEADGLHGQGRRPVVCQDGQTDVAIAVHVGVHRNVGPQEGHLWRVKWILGAKLEEELELLSFIKRALGTFHVNDPLRQVGSNVVHVYAHTRRWLFLHGEQLLLKPLLH